MFLADITPEMLRLCSFTKVKVFFRVLFNLDLTEFSAANLEKGLLWKVDVICPPAERSNYSEKL